MRAFVAAIILLALLTGVAFFASSTLTAKADAIAKQAKALPYAAQELREEACQTIAQAWKQERFAFSLTVNRNEIDALESALARLKAAANAESGDEFFIAASELTAAISRIRSICAVSLDNIL
jgi:hypothetical protein